MKRIKLIIFDLDGTLVDAYPAIIKSFNYSMRSLRYPERSSSVIRRAVGWGDESLLRPFVKKSDLEKALKIYRDHHKAALLKYSRLIPGAEKVLRYLLGKGYALAVASNRPTKFSLILIRHLGLNKYFSYVLCSDKLKYGKPHPQILRKIISNFSCKATDALYIGDMTIDAQAGSRAGLRTIIVTGGSSSEAEIRKEKPFRIIRKISVLMRIL